MPEVGEVVRVRPSKGIFSGCTGEVKEVSGRRVSLAICAPGWADLGPWTFDIDEISLSRNDWN